MYCGLSPGDTDMNRIDKVSLSLEGHFLMRRMGIATKLYIKK
jgi:hypothetical protein